MSFILDAIAKSERERQQQELPGPRILALPAGPAPQSRSLLPYVIVGALLLNAAVLVAWLQTDRTRLHSSASAPMTAVAPPREGAPAERDATPSDAATSAATRAPVEPDVAEPTVRSAKTAAVAAVNEHDAPGPAARPGADGDAIPGDWIRIGPDTLTNRAAVGQAEPVERGSLQPVRVSRLSELPPAVRDDLPKVVFSGHLFSSDPQSSIVFVDEGRPVTQGRRIVDDLYLHEITPTGVVVEFRGYLIDVGVLQNWTLN